MKISVIVPTYKPQEYLWECLDSIYNQSFPKVEYEVILVLNGCNEPYNTQIKEWLFRHDDMQVNFIQTDEAGVSNARNIALDSVKGCYVTFIDDDDFVSPDYLNELYKKATPDTIPLCYPYAFLDGTVEKQLPYRITVQYEVLHDKGILPYPRGRKYFSGPWMKLIPMTFIHDRRFDVRFKNGEDSLFMFLISDKFKYIDFTSKDATYYRRYRENSAVTTNRSFFDRFKNTVKMIRTYSHIFMNNPYQYNCFFFITRILGALRK